MAGEEQGGGARRYVMREKMLSLGDDYWISDDQGAKVFKVDGKAMRIRDTFVLEDTGGNEVAKIRERKLTIRDKMAIERGDRKIATVRTAMGWGDRYKIEVEGGDDLKAHGRVLRHDYKIERDGKRVATIHKKWFKIRDSYGVEIEPNQDDALILAAVVAIEHMSHRDSE